MENLYRAYANEALTVADSAIGFTSSVMNDTDRAKPDRVQFRIETAQIRYWVDGSDPTTSEGILGEVGELITIDGEPDANNFKAIRTGGTSATLQVVFSTLV